MTDKPAVDWRYWWQMPEVKQWEACALSLNIDPSRMKTRVHAWMVGPGSGPAFLQSSFPSESSKTDFEKRLRLLGACLFKSEYFSTVNTLVRGGRHLATVSLREFAAWGQSVEFEMPPELVAMAVPTRIMQATGKPVTDLGTEKKWTPDKLADLTTYRNDHTMPETAKKFGITEQRIRQLLPSKKPKAQPFTGLGNRIK